MKKSEELKEEREAIYTEIVESLREAKREPFNLSNDIINQALKEGLGDYYEEIAKMLWFKEVRELDKKHNKICEEKIREAVEKEQLKGKMEKYY